MISGTFERLYTLGALVDNEWRVPDAPALLPRAHKLNPGNEQAHCYLAQSSWKADFSDEGWIVIQPLQLDFTDRQAHQPYAEIARQRGKEAAQHEFAEAQFLSNKESLHRILRLGERLATSGEEFQRRL